jgi:hypothetical protein
MNTALTPVGPRHKGSSPEGVERSPVFAASSISATESLTAAVLEGERFIALTGEPGVSRSTIVDALVIRLIDGGIKVARVRNSAPGQLGVGRLVVLLLGGQHTRGADDDLQRVLRLLTEREHQGKRLVFVIEDADKLAPAALELLKFLPDLHREGSPRAQILLVGRPGFWALLAHRPSHAPFGKIAPSVAAMAPATGRVEDANPDQAIGTERCPALHGAIRLRGARGASSFLSQAADRPAARALLVIVFVITGVTLVAYVATTPANRLVVSDASGTAVILSGENQTSAAISDQPAVRSEFRPVQPESAPQPLTGAPPRIGVQGEGLHGDGLGQVRWEPPERMPSSELAERNGNNGSHEEELTALQRQNRNEMDVGSLFGGGISPPYPGNPPALILFNGQIYNTTMRRNGKLSLAITYQGSSGAITVRLDAGAGLLGSGELAGNLSENGRVSAHGRLMMGEDPFFCYLSGFIVGGKLIGSAKFVRTSGGRVAHSSFTLTRS